MHWLQRSALAQSWNSGKKYFFYQIQKIIIQLFSFFSAVKKDLKQLQDKMSFKKIKKCL